VDLGTIANWATIASGLVTPFLATALVALRYYIKTQIRPHLTNNSTSAASYARQARDTAEQALELATTTDARLSRVETKVDGLVLLQERNGSVAPRG
jgi:hypothetical protein